MIKKYWKFIRESIKEDIDDGKFWKLDEDDIREFLIDLDDENYLTTVTFGFVNEEESYNYKVNKTTTSQVFTEKVIPGDDIRPAYWILIETGRDTSSVDVTDSVIFAHDIIKEKVDGEITIHDEDGRLDINNIQLKGGLWIGKDESRNQKGEIFFKHSEQLEAKEYIALFVKQKNTVELTQKQVADYYEAIDSEITIPIFLQDIPQSPISPSLALELAKKCQNISYIKVETLPNVMKVSQMFDTTKDVLTLGIEPTK